jgi:hypothetical protein
MTIQEFCTSLETDSTETFAAVRQLADEQALSLLEGDGDGADPQAPWEVWT